MLHIFSIGGAFALTLSTFDEDVQRSLHAGLNIRLSKFVEPDSFCETLEALINEREKRAIQSDRPLSRVVAFC